jgi:hypothetical protein
MRDVALESAVAAAKKNQMDEYQAGLTAAVRVLEMCLCVCVCVL